MLNSIETARMNARILEARLDFSARDKIRQELDALNKNLNELATQLSTVKNLVSDSIAEEERFSVMEVIYDVQKILAAQLNNFRINLKTTSNTFNEMYGNKDALQYAFLNLVLNSIEAFHSKRRGKIGDVLNY